MCISSAILSFNSCSLFTNAWHNLIYMYETETLSGTRNRNIQLHSVWRESSNDHAHFIPSWAQRRENTSVWKSKLLHGCGCWDFLRFCWFSRDECSWNRCSVLSFHFNISRTNCCCFVFHSFWIIHVEYLLRPHAVSVLVFQLVKWN